MAIQNFRIPSNADVSGSINSLVPGVTSNFAGNLSVGGNLIVTGNLNVLGTVSGSRTVINSTDLYITDKTILIASGSTTDALLNNAGIEFGQVPTKDYSIKFVSASNGQHYFGSTLPLSASGHIGDGSGLTNLNAANISGLSIYARKDQANTFTANQYVNSTLTASTLVVEGFTVFSGPPALYGATSFDFSKPTTVNTSTSFELTLNGATDFGMRFYISAEGVTNSDKHYVEGVMINSGSVANHTLFNEIFTNAPLISIASTSVSNNGKLTITGIPAQNVKLLVRREIIGRPNTN